MADKHWDGRHVAVSYRHHPRFPQGVVDMQMGSEAARSLAIAIKRLKQTSMMNPAEVEELEMALDYVLVGDPRSRAAHTRMEASKGMEPSGG